MRSKPTEPFLLRGLRKVVINKEDFDNVVKIGEGNYNDVKSWSALKLVYLNYFAEIYANIMKYRYKGKFCYVDLFSGSGIGRVVDNKDDLILGSPLIAASKKMFPQMVFCDFDEGFSSILKSRLDCLGVPSDGYTMFNEDCNKVIDRLLEHISNSGIMHSLIFIDPYGMEIEWKSLEKLLSLDADIIFNYQTAEIPRGIQQQGYLTPTSQKFFKSSEDLISIYSNTKKFGPMSEALLAKYISDIKSTRNEIDATTGVDRKTITETIRIHKDDIFYYDLLFITRETKTGSPWLKAVRNAKNEIEKHNSLNVQMALNILKGRQSTLTSFKV